VFASTIAVIALAGWRPNIQWWLIAAAGLLLIFGDSYYALFASSYSSGGLVDASWSLAFGLIGTAAVVGRTGVRAVQSDAWRMMLMPATVMVLAVADLGDLALSPHARVLDLCSIGFAISSVIAGLWRLGFIFRENAWLADARQQALHDPLTGLPNRRLLFERLEDALASSSDVGPRTAVMVIDIDRFKDINDAFGHHAGDRVIEVVAGRLSRALLPGCTAARMGGDEFVVIAPGMADETEVRRLAHRIAGAVHEPCDVEGVHVHIELSVGIALYPDHGDEARLLLTHADAAMYGAKRSGEGVGVYEPETDAPTLERMTLAGEMLDAIASGDIFVVFQPKLDLRTRELSGVEALVRWRHPTRGLIPPAAFIPAAEQGTSLIRSLTLHVLALALAQCRLWLGGGHEVPVAVNLSARHLHDPKLPDDVRHLLDQQGIPARLLELEVTETAVMESPERSARTLEELRDIGVRIAIDDFGTGESSLRRLQTLPFHVLKIDRSFVAGMTVSASDRAIVETIVSLAHAVGVEAVGEGVEDLETLNLLAACGCDVAQGFYLGRPGEASAISRYLDQPRLRVLRTAS
jgi:diguanylate cyclase (GGDEF)-like protein